VSRGPNAVINFRGELRRACVVVTSKRSGGNGLERRAESDFDRLIQQAHTNRSFAADRRTEGRSEHVRMLASARNESRSALESPSRDTGVPFH